MKVGQLVWRTQHAALQRQLKGALADSAAGRALVDVTLDGSIGEPMTITITDGRGRSASAQTDDPLQVRGIPPHLPHASPTSPPYLPHPPSVTFSDIWDDRLQVASGAPLTDKAIRKAVGQLGGTPLMVGTLDVGSGVTDGAWLPLSQLKEARRLAVELLVEQRAAQRVPRPPPPVRPIEAAMRQGGEVDRDDGREADAPSAGPHLSVLCRTHEQVLAAAGCDAVDEIVIDFLELEGSESPYLSASVPSSPHRLPLP